MPPLFEAEVVPGLEACAIDELRNRFGTRVDRARTLRAGFIRFRFGEKAQELRELRSVIAVYRVHHFAVPRPKALLGHQHLTRLTRIIADASRSFACSPQSFGIGAAGSRSTVMRRLQQALAESLRLEPAADGKGELFLRLAPNKELKGWEALLRISPRPQSARDYRVVDMPGSLNATVAYAMTAGDPLAESAVVANLCSGTSTILIEHARTYPRHLLLAVDSKAQALDAGRRNARASGLKARIQHILADARQTPLPTHSVNRLYADLPFGRLIGSHEANIHLFPAILKEADRLASANAQFIVLTHEIKLLRRSLQKSPWHAAAATRINLRGLYARLVVLRRNSTRI